MLEIFTLLTPMAIFCSRSQALPNMLKAFIFTLITTSKRSDGFSAWADSLTATQQLAQSMAAQLAATLFHWQQALKK
jgi:hypothetical protein